MYVDPHSGRGESTSQERRDEGQRDRRILGHVVQCDGARAVISAVADTREDSGTDHWTVGRMISINVGSARTVGLVYEIARPEFSWTEDCENPIEVKLELIGEVRDAVATGAPAFDRGITVYPHIGAIAHRIRARDLKAVYEIGGRRSIKLGSLSQDSDLAANIAIDDTLARHFAVVGTTGVGKSTAVSLFLRKALEARPELRVLILDPHNEFAASLPEHAFRIGAHNLDLPFWLFRLEEFCEVLFRGREPIAEEVDVLRDIIPAARTIYRSGAQGLQPRRGSDSFTADTPVPYRIADLLRLLDERMGALDGKIDRPHLRALRGRLSSAIADPNYRFMFNAKLIEDSIQETIGQIFRIPHDGRSITCFEMAGMPSEVVNSVCSVLARLAFDVATWSEGRLKLLLLCEEAHRYMPADPRLGFAPTRHALSRIAKEGRKYGCFLGVVTQRPGDLDPTVLSQCSTVFAMRLANEADQAIIRSAIADSSASSLSFLSSMGQREAIAFGEGVAATMRLRFEEVPTSRIPGMARTDSAFETAGGDIDLSLIVDRLRNVARSMGSEAPSATRQPSDEGAKPSDVIEQRASVPAYAPPSYTPPNRPAIQDEYAVLNRGSSFGARTRG